jgi:uncharacterized membrane protein YkoI
MRGLTAILLAGVLVLGVTACNDGANSDNDETSADISVTTTETTPETNTVTTPKTTGQTTGATTVSATATSAATAPATQITTTATTTATTQSTAAQPAEQSVCIEQALEIAYAEIENRGYTGAFRESCRGVSRGREVWELLFRVQGGRKPLVEMYVCMETGEVLKWEWDD